MQTTNNRLASIAGLCTAAAGAIFVGVQINHPPADVAHLVTSEMTLRETAKALMCVLALVGITGLLLQHRRRLGRLGHLGYMMLMVGFLGMFVQQCIVGYVLPSLADSDPRYVQDVLHAAMGKSPQGSIGHVKDLMAVTGIAYAIGGLLFGISIFRAGAHPRWAAALLAYGTVSALALAALPESFDRPFAVPTGIALVGLGIGLWRQQQTDENSSRAIVVQPATR